MSKFTTISDWEKISLVEGQTDREEVINFDGNGLPYTSEQVVFQCVWITGKNGDIFMSDIQHGETLEQRVAHYKKLGRIDSRCDLFRAA